MKKYRWIHYAIALIIICSAPITSSPAKKKSRVAPRAATVKSPAIPPPPDQVTISELAVSGRIEGENIIFTLVLTADVLKPGIDIPLVAGDVAYLKGDLPGNAKLSRRHGCYILSFADRGKQRVKFEFASHPDKQGDWRRTRFVIPTANIREISLLCDRDDLAVEFPGALNVKRKKIPLGKTMVTASLGIGNSFEVRWKPKIKKLAAERIVESVANTIATAHVGALRLDTVFKYRIVQGTLNALSINMPKNCNILQVLGDDIKNWAIDKKDPGHNVLKITLNQTKEDNYSLRVTGEMILPAFPCKFDLPVLIPGDVIRTSGFMMIGTDSAIKLLVDKATGLTQIDKPTFRVTKHKTSSSPARALPAKGAFYYQYANLPYTLNIAADDIITTFTVEDQILLSVKDNDLILNAALELDIKDAPARELVIEVDPSWTVANVSGADVADYDVRDEDKLRLIQAHLRRSVLGRTLLNIRLESKLGDDPETFVLPAIKVRGAKSERGYLALSSEKGLRLKLKKSSGLREVHTGSIPMKIADAQLAFRFKEPNWEATISIERAVSGVHSELFHLLSLGEGIIYGSTLITYHISGAPVREFKLFIPDEYQNVEFTGRDIRGWTQESNLWTVSIQEKIMGDYTLMASYNRQYASEGADISIGGVHTADTESEVGYMIMASSIGLEIKEDAHDPSIIRIDRTEIPGAYALLINAPILCSYKYAKTPHIALTTVSRYKTEEMLSQVVDHASLKTEVNPEGEAVTTITYFIKNASDQYFNLMLPKNAKFWSARLTRSGGKKSNLTALKGENGSLLIPIPRFRDMNLPMQVEVTYAQSQHAFSRLLSGIHLEAPLALKAQMPFAKWTVAIPAGYAAAKFNSNMLSLTSKPANGLGTIAIMVENFYRALITKLPQWTILTGIFLVMSCAGAFLAGYRKKLFVPALVIGTCAALGLIVLLFHPDNSRNLVRIGRAFTAANHDLTTLVFTKSVNLTNDPALFVDLRLIPGWIGGAGSAVVMLASLAAGIWMTFLSVKNHRLHSIQFAIGLALLTLAVAQISMGRLILGMATIIAIPLAIFLLLPKASHRHGLKKRPKKKTVPVTRPGLQPFEPLPEPDSPAPADAPGQGGYIRLNLLWICLLLSTLIIGGKTTFQASAAQGKAEAPIVMQSIKLEVNGPASGKDAEKSASVIMQLEFEIEQLSSSWLGFREEQLSACILIPSSSILTGFKANSRHVKLTSSPKGYALRTTRGGKFRATLEYQAPVKESGGVCLLKLNLPDNLKNEVILKIPQADLKIESKDAVYFKSKAGDNYTQATAIFGDRKTADFSWRPKERSAAQEQLAFFSEVNTVAAFQPGVVTLTHLVLCQITQGELKSLQLSIPAGVNVITVSAPDLSNWRFLPETRILDVFLNKPVSKTFTLKLVTQAAYEGLPYTATISVPQVKDASRQRGALALAAPDTVQTHVETSKGLHNMNISDFSSAAIAAAHAPNRSKKRVPVRRAFRYQALPVSAKVRTEGVLPEVRVKETSSLSIGDERIMLSSQLRISVARAGVFSVQLNIPADFDVETLTGRDISHWDEIRNKEHSIIVNFNKQISGTTALNLVLARMEKGIEETITIPRISVVNELKHSGSLVASAERGVRLTTIKREGISEVNPRELGIKQQGVLAFKLLRPDWLIILKTEVVSPAVKPEVLQLINLAEGVLKGSATICYKIENAGCKNFYIKAPQPGLTLAISGRNIAKIQHIDATQGIWQVTLHSKVENNYTLSVTYQLTFDPGLGQIAVDPLLPLQTETPKGYLAIMTDGRLQAKPVGEFTGLREEDARNIPAYFGAGSLADAILCYRIIQPDYHLTLAALRHEKARALPAKVESANLVSAISPNDQMLTQVSLQMNVGNMRYLSLTLPNKNDRLWSVFVNGKAAMPMHDGDVYRIPLDTIEPGESAFVECMYANGPSPKWRNPLSHRLEGPKFDLPLTDISWKIYLPPDRRYFGFGGSLEVQQYAGAGKVHSFDSSSYLANVDRQRNASDERAIKEMRQGALYAREGKQKLAKKSLVSALNYSQGRPDMNEDARIQYRNLIHNQAVAGLVVRRGAVRQAQNILGERQAIAQQNSGNLPTEAAHRILQSLSAKDNKSLVTMTDKMLTFQEAAAGMAQAIRITLPAHGRAVTFTRLMQTNPDEEMFVKFKSFGGGWMRFVIPTVSFLLLITFYGFLLRKRPFASGV